VIGVSPEFDGVDMAAAAPIIIDSATPANEGSETREMVWQFYLSVVPWFVHGPTHLALRYLQV